MPAFNEARFLSNLLFEISEYASKKDILVINDGSTDNTGEIAEMHGVKVIHHAKNEGKGAALLSAFRFAKKEGYDWVVTLDSDGQHAPVFLKDFFRQIESTDATIILGNRADRMKKMPFHRILSNGVTSIIISLLAGNQRIHDSQCGYRAIRVSQLDFMQLKEQGFQFESELLIHVGRSGGKVEEQPIDTVYGKEASSIRLFSDTLKFIRLALYHCWR